MFGVAVLDLLAAPRDVGPLAERAPDRGVDVRRAAPTGGDAPAGSSLTLQKSVRFGSTISVRSESSACSALRARDDQVLAPLRDFGARRDQVERRRLADVDPRPVGPLELQRQIQRLLLHVDRRQRRHQVPVGALARSPRPARRAPGPGCRRFAVAALDLDLRPRRVDLEVAQQRLREDRLQRRRQRRVEAGEHAVGGRPLRRSSRTL